MQGLMMDYQLNVPAILRRAEQVFGDVPIVSRLPDRSFHRMTNADLASRAGTPPPVLTPDVVAALVRYS